MEEPEGIPPDSTEPVSLPEERPEPTPGPPPVQVLYPRMEPAKIAERRNPVPWILLFLLFSFLIVATVTSLRKPSIQSGDQYWEDVQAIKEVVHQKRLASLLPTTGASPRQAVASDTMADLRSKIATNPKPATDATAARLLVEAEFESGQKISDADLNHVSATKDPVDLAFANIYRAKTLTTAQAAQMTAGFSKTRFSYTLARVHAFDKAGDPRPRDELSPKWKMEALAGLTVCAILAVGLGCVLWMVFIVLKTDGRLPVPQHPAEPMSGLDADKFAYRAVLLVATFLLIGIGVSAFQKATVAAEMFGTYGIMLIAVILIHKLPVLGMRIPLSRLGVSTKNLGKNIGYGVVGYFMALPGLAVSLGIGAELMKIFGKSTHPAAEIATSNPNLATILALFFSASVVAPFWEEIMFRGTLLPALARVLGRPVWGILLSSFMFAAIHPQGVPLWLALGFIGGMNGMLAYQTRSLVPCMVLHALNNGIVLTLALLLS